MGAVWIILGILAALSLLIGAVLALPLDLVLQLQESKGFSIALRILGKTIPLDQPADPQKKSLKKQKKSAFAEKIKKMLGISHLQSFDEMQKAVEERGTTETVADTLKLIGEFAGDFLKLWEQCKMARCRIRTVAGGEDAPLIYGTACAVLYPLVAYFEQAGKLKARGKRLEIECDYQRSESLLEFEIIFRLRAHHLLGAFWRIIRRNVEKEVAS